MLKGIDFSFGSGLTTAEIKAAGKAFVCRYLSGGLPKDIGIGELEAYRNAAISVVMFFETTGTDMVSTAKGVEDASVAQRELDNLAALLRDKSFAETPVFFAADAPVEVDESDYLRGTASVIGLHRNALYGGFASIKRAFDAKLITYGMQTYAWSGGVWDDRALLRQVQNAVKLGPAEVDLDEAAYWNSPKILGEADDFGQWPKPGAVAPPPPPPPPPPVQREYVVYELPDGPAFKAISGMVLK